jgi:acetyl esterase/lipase
MSITHNSVDLDVDLYPITTDGPTPAVLILPGGGFRELTAHDGEGYARWLNNIGIAAAVLNYQLGPEPFPLSLQQARAALDALQQGVLVPNLDPAKVGVIGSSAGGLLAGLLATGAVLSIEEYDGEVPRPAFQIQSYGLADLGLLPPPAVEALLGDKVHLAAELSPVTHVDGETSPTFAWVTAQDGPGLPNALEWTRTLAEHQVPVELHVYPEGRHGLGLANGVAYGEHGHQMVPHTAQWTTACARWLQHLGIDLG